MESGMMLETMSLSDLIYEARPLIARARRAAWNERCFLRRIRAVEKILAAMEWWQIHPSRCDADFYQLTRRIRRLLARSFEDSCGEGRNLLIEAERFVDSLEDWKRNDAI
jgi:hypothetical protein